MATVRELVTAGLARLRDAGSDTARLDTELLLAYALDTDRTAILAHTDAPVGDGAVARFEAALDRRAAGEPVAYIRGFKEFHGLAFGVDERALIPRPETERLVELAELEVVRRLIGAPRPAGSPPLRIVDVGVGSGAVAITLAVLLRRRRMLDEVEIVATDVSPEALQLARENAVAHAVGDRIAFEQADLLPSHDASRWDLVVANLPYVRSDAVPELPRAASYEPQVALDGGPDGLRVIAQLLDQLPVALAEGGAALLEIGGDQEAEFRAQVAERLDTWACEVERDLGGLPRVGIVRVTAPMTAVRLADGPEARLEAARVLRDGGIVAVPTDTVYGIAVALDTPGGIERLFAAKARPPDKAIALLLADGAQAGEIGDLTPAARALAAAFWPGGLTLVVPRRADRPLPAALTGGALAPGAIPTVGLRVPDHPAPRALAAAVGPLPTTSANRSGEPEARDADEIEALLGGAIDFILDGGAAGGGPASTVVDVTGEAPLILREGAIDKARIADVLGSAGRSGVGR